MRQALKFLFVFVPVFCIVLLAVPYVRLFGPAFLSGALFLRRASDLAPQQHGLPEDYAPVHRGEVDLGTGLYIRHDEDIVLRGTPPMVLRRTYRNNDGRSRAFGVGSTHRFEWFLVGEPGQFQQVSLIVEDGARINFNRVSTGTSYQDAVFEHRSTPSEYHGAFLGWTALGWTMRMSDGSVGEFEACASNMLKPRPCGLISWRDSDGHEIRGTRDRLGRLLRIETSADRWIAFDYDEGHRVTRAYDHGGFEVLYTYDERGRLVRAKTPDGVERRYGYTDRTRCDRSPSQAFRPRTSTTTTGDASDRSIVGRGQRSRSPMISRTRLSTPACAVRRRDIRMARSRVGFTGRAGTRHPSHGAAMALRRRRSATTAARRPMPSRASSSAARDRRACR
jgi:YD repeat-containing protein